MIIAAGYAVQFTGNQCIERLAGPLTHPLVVLTGQWIVATGNTVLHNQVASGVNSLVLQPYLGVNCRAIATTNILNGPPLLNGTFTQSVINPNISV